MIGGGEDGRLAVMKSIGVILLGIWLIATGLIPLINLQFRGLTEVMCGLAIAAGVLLLIRR